MKIKKDIAILLLWLFGFGKPKLRKNSIIAAYSIGEKYMTSTASHPSNYSLYDSSELLSAIVSIKKVSDVLMGLNLKEQKITEEEEEVSVKKMYVEGTESDNPKQNFLAAWVAFKDFTVLDQSARWDLRVQVRLDSPEKVEVIFNIMDGSGFHVYEVGDDGLATGLKSWLQNLLVPA